jgi:hypothetical protein
MLISLRKIEIGGVIFRVVEIGRDFTVYLQSGGALHALGTEDRPSGAFGQEFHRACTEQGIAIDIETG